MGFLAGVANIVGKAARFTAKAGGEIVRFGGQIAGGAVELAHLLGKEDSIKRVKKGIEQLS